MTYTLNNSISVQYKEKRSEFIGFSQPVKSTLDLNKFIRELRSKYPSARHICWAYRFSVYGKIEENSSDAGEPSGSAGVPILNVLKQHQMVNCSILIVRYFGGVKLGKQGLINAYKITTEKVIAESELIKWIPKQKFLISAPLDNYGKVTYLLKKCKGKIIRDLTTVELRLLVELPIKGYASFLGEFKEITQNSGVIKKAE